MCGIVGIYAYHYASPPVDRNELLKIRAYMCNRGPDAFGEWFSQEGRVGLGHHRLSIIDLNERSAQPMLSQDGQLVITFNGEIYNYRSIRKILESKGYFFRTESDTEVILALYHAKGPEMVRDLRGMFAFGLWDSRKNTLMMARDPYGIKPLYYADDGWTLRFASQVKALRAGGRISSDPEPAGITGFYLLGSVPEPHTIYREIRAVPAGTTIFVHETGPSEPKRFFCLAKVFEAAESKEPANLREGEILECFRQAFVDSVRHHLVADVPVGAFLSAGVDSGALVGLMADAGVADIQTVTLAFTEYGGTERDEAPFAEEVARLFGTKHTTRRISLEEFRENLPQIIEDMDQPTIDGINTWFVSKTAKELGLKVAVSGLGGDELLGGYDSFSDIPVWCRWLSIPSHLPLIGRVGRLISTPLLRWWPSMSPKAGGLIEYGGTYAGAYLLKRGVFMPWELSEIMNEEVLYEGIRRLQPLKHISGVLNPCPRRPWSRVAVLEAGLYMRNQLLRDTDWASMAHSLEVRVPLVDSKLLEELAPLLTSGFCTGSKMFLARSPSQPLPEHIQNRRKTGFNTPVNEWLQADQRLQCWRQNRVLSASHCSWAKRWAYVVASSSGLDLRN